MILPSKYSSESQYDAVAGTFNPVIEFPRPAVYHRECKADVYKQLYPDLLEKNVATLEELLAAIEDADPTVPIVLTANLTEVEPIQIPEGKEVVLDLGGFNIEAALRTEDRHYYAIDNYGTLKLTGKGTITARGIENFGVMVIEGEVEIQDIDTNGGAAVWNEGVLTVNGGTFVTTHVGSPSDSYGAGCLNNSGEAVINGGTFRGANRRTYAIISTNNIVVNNADVHGAHGGLAVDDGVCTVKAGTFVSDDYYGLYVSNDADDETDPDEADILIEGGTFTGKTYSVWIGSDVKSPVNSVIRIKAGNFTNPLKMQKNVAEGAGIVEYPEDEYDLIENADGSRELRKKEAVINGDDIVDDDF